MFDERDRKAYRGRINYNRDFTFKRTISGETRIVVCVLAHSIERICLGSPSLGGVSKTLPVIQERNSIFADLTFTHPVCVTSGCLWLQNHRNV